MNSSPHRIWRPAVTPNNNPLPRPGSLVSQQQTYTKTSLVAADRSSCDRELVRSLNRDILNASQAYNNSPKPFTRQLSGPQVAPQPSITTTAVTTLGPTKVRESSMNLNESHQVASHSQQKTFNLDDRSSLPSHRPQSQETQEENMAPKLIHKQYNSPIDLYSMNNIRKTIEAHTELIAPGVKGINFMKPETPINKQSEVYKLVMEEEHPDRHGISRLSPITGQPLNIPTGIMEQPPNQRPTETRSSHLSPINEHHGQQYTTTDSQKSFIQQQHQENQQGRTVASQPSCCECGRFIVGPFAKIQNRFVHPQCLNCTTCGTSLRNTGYFTVNEKLYCEIHAKQVAKMMRIQYDFSDKQQVNMNQQAQMKQQSHQQQQQSQLQQDASIGRQDQVEQHGSSLNRAYQQSSTLRASSPATISTMFADRSQDAGSERTEIKWTWRPAKSEDRKVSETQQTSSHQQEMRTLPNTNLYSSAQQNQQQSMVSMGTRGRGLLQENTLVGGRIPVCCHCQAQVQGPYILAGKTTWCKQCSQTHFNCSSCRRSLLDIGFIEDSSRKYYCEHCFEAYYAPVCSKCNIKIKGDCLNALGKQWHPSCFVCGHCHRPFGNSSFYLEDNVPYCERDWKTLFTTRCFSCSLPIEAGDKWIEALNRNYHSNCFKCTSCLSNLEGSTFYCKAGKPYCRLHAK